MRGRGWAWAGLVAALAFDLWWRGHTVGPTLRDRLGVELYPVTGAASEPLDCDEAVYAYIGKRLARGAVMYRDLTENKPPGGYWAYALTVALGGYDELTVRLMPLPFVLANLALVWWLGLRLRGPGAAVLAAFLFALVSTDPFLYGNGANMEPMINLAATASLALVVSAWDRPGRGRLVAAGAALGAAALVKQVAALHGLVYAASLLLRQTVETAEGARPRRLAGRLIDVAALGAGFAAVWLAAVGVLVVQGAGPEAFDDVVRYAAALARETPTAPHAPPLPVRWFTGNADPEGALPWPFGRTNYLVWWGTGTWPVWLAAVPALGSLLFGRKADAPRRLVAAWTLSAWVQVALPRLFWAHYYLLPVPGLSVVVAVFLADRFGFVSQRAPGRLRNLALALLTTLAIGWTVRTQVVEYLWVSPEQLTVRDKGGAQWVEIRAMGEDLAQRATLWPRPTLYVWGWQTSLYFYSGLDGVTRHVFTDDFLKNFAGSDHPQARPRVDRIMRDLEANPPSLIYVNYAPFPALAAFLRERYLPSHLIQPLPDGRGLWVERSRYGAFETYPVKPRRPAGNGTATRP